MLIYAVTDISANISAFISPLISLFNDIYDLLAPLDALHLASQGLVPPLRQAGLLGGLAGLRVLLPEHQEGVKPGRYPDGKFYWVQTAD